MGIIGIQAQLVFGNIGPAPHTLGDRTTDFGPPVLDHLSYLSGVKEPCARIADMDPLLMGVHQLLVEEEVQLSVPAGNQIERLDVIGKSFQDFARYPSGPHSVPSRNAVLDPDVQLLDDFIAMIVVIGVRHYAPP
ncbi:uncharacterized protein METZ01_LOCUS238988 [marine metagenome]|uniref:Uncharacterized protein n=1 Tax=marine metagenome TaxID=408172 RepID=A0A382HFL8_9ZZZZ